MIRVTVDLIPKRTGLSTDKEKDKSEKVTFGKAEIYRYTTNMGKAKKTADFGYRLWAKKQSDNSLIVVGQGAFSIDAINPISNWELIGAMLADHQKQKAKQAKQGGMSTLKGGTPLKGKR